MMYGSTSPSKKSTVGTPQRSFKMLNGSEKAASDEENFSKGSDKHSVISLRKESLRQSNSLGYGDADNEERLGDKSDSVLSMETETEGSKTGKK